MRKGMGHTAVSATSVLGVSGNFFLIARFPDF